MSRTARSARAERVEHRIAELPLLGIGGGDEGEQAFEGLGLVDQLCALILTFSKGVLFLTLRLLQGPRLLRILLSLAEVRLVVGIGGISAEQPHHHGDEWDGQGGNLVPEVLFGGTRRPSGRFPYG